MRQRMITAYGETRSISEWSRVLGMSKSTIARRLLACATPEEALSCEYEDELWPGANTLSWKDDVTAQLMLAHKGPMQLDFIGACLGVSKQRVSQIEQEALRKLRRAAEKRYLLEDGQQCKDALWRMRCQILVVPRCSG